jgi:hypothetical protein
MRDFCQASDGEAAARLCLAPSAVRPRGPGGGGLWNAKRHREEGENAYAEHYQRDWKRARMTSFFP